MLLCEPQVERLRPERVLKGSVKPTNPSQGRRDPLWVRLENAIFRALLPFAEARAAVSLALAEVDSA